MGIIGGKRKVFVFNFKFINKIILRDKLDFILFFNEFWVSIFLACILFFLHCKGKGMDLVAYCWSWFGVKLFQLVSMFDACRCGHNNVDITWYNPWWPYAYIISWMLVYYPSYANNEEIIYLRYVDIQNNKENVSIKCEAAKLGRVGIVIGYLSCFLSYKCGIFVMTLVNLIKGNNTQLVAFSKQLIMIKILTNFVSIHEGCNANFANNTNCP